MRNMIESIGLVVKLKGEDKIRQVWLSKLGDAALIDWVYRWFGSRPVKVGEPLDSITIMKKTKGGEC